jgi:3-dehydro-L-gulonate-6-phosphate decarboxylase
MTRIQLALDGDLRSSLAALHQVADLVDIVEVGTLLILREGLSTVGMARALAPDLPILADVRIAEAGGAIARLAFDAGSSWVSMVASASSATVREVCRCAREYGGEVQIELGEEPDLRKIPMWLDEGVQHVIVHRSRDAAQNSWTAEQIERVDELAGLGFTVTVTGGITVAEAEQLTHTAADIVIVGRGIADAGNPRSAAAEYRAAVDREPESVR